jgi:UDP-glucuronate 4-epimerase
MRILLTGAAGFVGSHLAESLLRARHEIVAIDNYDPLYPRDAKTWNLRDARKMGRFDLYEHDICNYGQLEHMLKTTRFDVIVHLAARSGARGSLEHAPTYNKINVTGTLNLLEAARRHGPKRFVLASCASVYGDCDGAANEEKMELTPLSVYGVSKLTAERYARVYHDLFGMKVTILRFFTLYGPRQRPDQALVRFARALLKGEKIDLSDGGKIQRDFTFVLDAVDAATRAIQKDEPFQIYNIGTGKAVAIKDVMGHLEALYGQKVKTRSIPASAEIPPKAVADIRHISQALGWKPTTDLKTGVQAFFNWFTKSRPTMRMLAKT